MNNMVAIDQALHKETVIDTNKIEQHGSNLNLVPTVVGEFASLACHYPIVITKNEETGQFVPVAMLGFNQGENLFWDKVQEQWTGLYLPLQIQRQPFFLGAVEEAGEVKSVVCMNTDSPAVVEEGSESGQVTQQKRLFTEDGQETEFFHQSKASLAQLLQGEKETDAFIKQLLELDLLQTLSLEITFEDSSTHSVKGLYTINKNKLMSLSQESVWSLHSSGFLEAIHTLSTSLGQIYRLVDLKNKRLASAPSS